MDEFWFVKSKFKKLKTIFNKHGIDNLFLFFFVVKKILIDSKI